MDDSVDGVFLAADWPSARDPLESGLRAELPALRYSCRGAHPKGRGTRITDQNAVTPWLTITLAVLGSLPTHHDTITVTGTVEPAVDMRAVHRDDQLLQTLDSGIDA